MRADIVLVDAAVESSPTGEEIPVLDAHLHRHLLGRTVLSRQER